MDGTNVNEISGFNHIAFRCRDADETTKFYEELVGLPLAWAISNDRVGSIGVYDPHIHIFFELPDGSYLAFFELLEHDAPLADPNTPSWVQHIAFSVPDMATLEAAKRRLEAAGVEVVGPKTGERFNSIYFFDPNGHRLELTYSTMPIGVAERHEAREVLAAWQTRKRA